MSLTALLLICTALLNVTLGVYVLRRSPRAASHQAFFGMATALGLWTFALMAAHYAPLGNTWALRIAFAAGSLFPLGILTFVENTPSNLSWRWPIRSFFAVLPISAAFGILSFSSLIVVSVRPSTSHIHTVYGPLHPVFCAFIVLSFGYAVLILASRYRVSTGAARTQIGHLLLAFACPWALATLTNVLVPLLFGTSSLSKYGPFFTLPMVGLIAHSIIHHRLLTIRVVVRHSAVYLAAFCVAGLVLITLLSASNAVVHSDAGVPIRESLLALLVALGFAPLKNRIQLGFDKYLYRDPYDYQQIVRESSQYLGTTIQLDSLLAHLLSTIERALKPERVAIYLLDTDECSLRLANGLSGTATFPASLTLTAALDSQLLEQYRTPSAHQTTSQLASAVALSELAALEVTGLIPLIAEESVFGVVCLGQKRSGDGYLPNDFNLLHTLTNQASVAIRNAQAHQHVVELNDKLKTVIGTIESGVVAVNSRSKIVLFNRSAERLTGTPEGSASGQPAHDLPPALSRCILDTLSSGRSLSQVEFSLPDSSGQLLPVACSTSPLLSPSSKIVGAVAVINDISLLKALEQEKRRTERLSSIEAIAAGLVHEIRNPLVAVKTFSQLLPAKHHDPEFRETFSRTAGREIRRIDDLLTRFRTLVSASDQPMGLVDVSDPIQHILDLLRPQFDERGIRIRQVSGGNVRRIVGNTSQLEQLFLNLCLNAMEAMKDGDELTVRVADLCDGGGTTLLVEVSDTGVGISEEFLPKIFDPFVSTKVGGSGLGLAICRGVADAHRARLTARNNVGRPGSTFTIEFPVPVSVASPAAAT